jgi:hypothetical protein
VLVLLFVLFIICVLTISCIQYTLQKVYED